MNVFERLLDRRSLRLMRVSLPVALSMACIALLLGLVGQISAAPAQQQSNICFATADDGATVFASADSQAVRDAVNAASAGGTVKIAGTCAGTANEGGTEQVVIVDKALTLAGSYTVTNWITPSALQTTTLDALQDGRVLLASAALTLRDLTIQNGLTTDSTEVDQGAGIRTSQSITLSQVIVFNNATMGVAGGGAYIIGSASITGSVFQSNQARFGGGGAAIIGGADITGTQFIGNVASGDGGGILVQGVTTISGSSFINNLSNSMGGGALLGEIATIADTFFISNTASTFGGGMGVGNANIVGTSFSGNMAQFGGGAVFFLTANITATEFLSNTASDSGGGAYIGGSVSQPSRVINALFASNRALNNRGSALYIAGNGGSANQLALLHNTIASPSAQDGAAIFVNDGTVGITNTILSNQATAIERSNGTVNEDYNLFANVTTPYAGTIASGGNSISGTSAFVDAVGGDYRITANSDAINAGTDAGISEDFFGDARPQQDGFDIGFDEFEIAPLCFSEYTGDNVTDFSSADSQAVREAVAAANPGDTVKIAGACAGVVTQGGGEQIVIVDKVLTLAGGYTVTNWITPSALQTTTLDALQSGRVISATAALTVRDLTIQNGRTTAMEIAGYGAGIYTNQAITLNQVIFWNNATTGKATFGGGAYVNGMARITGSEFLSNTTVAGGGGAYVNSTANISGTSFLKNKVAGSGGGAYVNGTANITVTSFLSNTAGSFGGGVYVEGTASVTGTSFVSNTAGSEGGGANFRQAASIGNSSFISNTARGDGGGAVVRNGASITGTSFFSNVSGSTAGGIAVIGVANITGSSFFNNRASSVGGMAVNGVAKITGTSFLSNTGQFGGGAYVLGTASIAGSSFISNTAEFGGGALIADMTSEPSQVVNTLFVNNRATNTQGSALYVFGSSDNANRLALLHSTVASSVASDGAAIFVNNGTVGITNTIVSNHAIAIERVDGDVTEDFNLFDTVTTPFSGTVAAGIHSITGTAAFVDPANNDYQLTAASDAINAGTDAGVTVDYFGDVRPQQGGFDIGFDESPFETNDWQWLPLIQRD